MNKPMREDFLFSDGREPHRDRTVALIRAHPDVREHIQKNPYSILVIVGLVSLQIVTGGLLANSPWWVLVLVAYLVGAFASHALWVMIHECAHNLLFRKSSWNSAAAILANLPHVLPSAVSFQRYHLKHHAFQGIYDLDADLPNYWEARLVGNSPLRKAVWMFLFPLFQITRPLRLKEIHMLDSSVVFNMLIQVGFDVAIFVVLGPKALLYLLLSFWFSVGLHPLGARWIQEHYLMRPSQETYSYYGRLNSVAFNVGYHNEHHDLPSVPWNHLPAIRKTAPELYDSLAYHTSWTKLMWRFVFDPEVTLFSRMVRVERGACSEDVALASETV